MLGSRGSMICPMGATPSLWQGHAAVIPSSTILGKQNCVVYNSCRKSHPTDLFLILTYLYGRCVVSFFFLFACVPSDLPLRKTDVFLALVLLVSNEIWGCLSSTACMLFCCLVKTCLIENLACVAFNIVYQNPIRFYAKTPSLFVCIYLTMGLLKPKLVVCMAFSIPY